MMIDGGIDITDVYNALRNSKNGKSAAADGIPAEVYKTVEDEPSCKLG